VSERDGYIAATPAAVERAWVHGSRGFSSTPAFGQLDRHGVGRLTTHQRHPIDMTRRLEAAGRTAQKHFSR
jgi:hypothetical protein